LDQVGTSCKRPFRVTLSPKCSYRAPISQQKEPWDSQRKNPGENTALWEQDGPGKRKVGKPKPT